MPEEQTKEKKRRDGASDGAKLARLARDQLSEITELDAEAVTSLSRAEDGTWKVTVELLELERIPNTDDVLGSYEAQLDGDGNLLGYRRVRRYTRSQADADPQG